MSSTADFERYLSLFRLRLKQLVLARGFAVLAVAGLLITVVAVSIAIRRGFPDELVITSRVLLVAALAAIVYWLVVLPRRRIDSDGSSEIEELAPLFGGRITTWMGVRDSSNPIADLLAEDSLRLAADQPPERNVRPQEFALAYSVAGIAASCLLALAIIGPGNYAYGVRDLWFGWAFPNLLPPQSIEVLPGDDGIRKGGTVNVHALMQGFDPAAAWVHARFGDGEWQQVEMADLDRQFEFTFFSVREPLEYFVSAANVRSPTYTVKVVDLPAVENLAVTYRFPAWTEKAAETRDPGGDIRAIADTEIDITITADRPMSPGELVLGEQKIPLRLDGNSAAATFSVTADGQYFVAAKVGGEQIRLTDDYFITLLDDAVPKIEFARPGRDWSASSIEEVTARISARDDFRLESLELRFSVNGSDWQAVSLPVDTDVAEIDHVFFLESLSQFVDGEGLVPGDLVSYYAVATDRGNSARTDIFFIDVQPFDRRYSQSQQAGGQMGGQGQQQDEISQRQREIIVSTWNLIREQQEGRRNDPAYVSDNAALLSRVQSTLREQVETLARRTEARQLTASTEDIARFVEHLEKASEAMLPAAERLGELELEQAILPEQEALQHLLAAEAVFTDISVSLQANNRGGGRGGQAGRDLTEMFELEMDLEKNQYETGSRATPNPPQQEMEEAANELEELARRQEQLARNMNRNQKATPAERWQQEMLRRDVEQLRQRLERLQQQQSASNQSQSQSQGGAGSSSQSEPSASSQSEAEREQANNRQLDELRRRLESAVRAMNEADEAMRNGGSPEELQRAANEAQRQLEGARDQASEEMRRAMQASLDDLAERADDFYDTQQAMENKLQNAIRGVSVGRNSFERLDSGMSIEEEREMAAEKRRLQTAIQKLEQDTRNTAQQIADDQPRASEQLREALEKLRESEIATRIAVAAAYIEQGEAVYVAGSESAVTDALRELQQDLERARSMTEPGRDGDGGAGEQRNGLAETLAETRQLRRQLQRLAEGNANGGAITDRGRDDLQRSTGIWVDDLDLSRDFDRDADSLSQDVISLFRDFRGRGVPVQDIDELRRLAAQFRASDFSGNPALLEEEARRALANIEQLEMALARTAREGNGRVRTSAADEIPEAHREIIADYYRRLGRSGELDNSPEQPQIN